MASQGLMRQLKIVPALAEFGMALVLPPPPLPDAHPFTCPTPASTPAPAATLKAVVPPCPGNPSSSASFFSPPSSSPPFLPRGTAGRSKGQRWRDDSPLLADSSDALSPLPRRSISFKEALLKGVDSTLQAPCTARRESSVAVSQGAPGGGPPRIVLRPEDSSGMVDLRAPDRDGWWSVEGRRRRRERWRQARP
uniref:Uncharacterized protein n=1 Tax=Setaria italica TaxID=4555 RepID=A0A0Q3VBW0_SETIT